MHIWLAGTIKCGLKFQQIINYCNWLTIWMATICKNAGGVYVIRLTIAANGLLGKVNLLQFKL